MKEIINSYLKILKPIELFYFLGIVITLYFLINFLNFFSQQFLEWTIYISIYFIAVIFFVLSFTNYKKFHYRFTYFFAIVFVLFFFVNFTFSIIDITLLIISFFLLLIFKNFNSNNIYKVENLIQFIFFFIFFKLAISLFYWIELKSIFWKDIFENINTYPLYKNYIDNFFFFFNLTKVNYEILTKYIQILYPFLVTTSFALILLLFYFYKNKENKIEFINKYWWILPAGIFFLESFSTNNFFSKSGGGAMAHWQAFIGTIELMRGGGFLLWDTPSQYGFLSLISIYLMPFNDPWMNLYILNSSIKFFISLLFFKLFWNRGNLSWYIISLLLTWFLFFIVSNGHSFGNSSSTPSSGPLRYIWVIVICSTLVSIKNYPIKNQLIFILPIWIIGFLWSFESAFYVSSAISPYLIYVLFFSNLSQQKRILYFLSFPVTLVIMTTIICLYYIIILGHLPDVISFIEYSVSWYGGFSSSSINYFGPVWIPIIILSWISIEFFYCNKVKDKFIILSIWCGLWSICSYTVTQTFDIVFIKQLYLYIFFFFLTHKLIGFNKDKIFQFSPLILILITVTFTYPAFIRHIVETINNQSYNLKKTEHKVIDDYNEILTLVNPNDTSVI